MKMKIFLGLLLVFLVPSTVFAKPAQAPQASSNEVVP